MGDGMDPLEQFEWILEADELIDEVGFLHPSQFTSLDDNDSGEPEAKTEAVLPEAVDSVQYNKTIFWIRNHKLAISAHALSELYIAARHAFMTVCRSYRESVGILENGVDFGGLNGAANSDHVLENEVLKHTKALLILSCNFSSAWNCRKLVLMRKNELPLFFDELRFSTLILSYSPKCESAWSQRRWVVKTLAEKLPELQDIVGQESELVKKIAEKAKMNYRAWSHRGWLISYMTGTQVLDELATSRKWAELHVADNCCFHYRRRLMLKYLEDNQRHGETSCVDVCSIWKEELGWNELLIRRYTGREALWTHRRFLAQCWINHFTTNEKVVTTYLENNHTFNSSMEDFLRRELQLVHSCLNISADEFDDIGVHSQLAASYILWISKFCMPKNNKLEESIIAGELKTFLLKACSESILHRGCLLN